MAKTIIKADSIDFQDIKDNFRDYLRNNSEFKDYAYEGSVLSTLIDILAYNTYYNNLYRNFQFNESFIDSASLYSSVASHSKALGYIPRSRRAARAYLNVTISEVPGNPSILSIPAGVVFKSRRDNDEYRFSTIEPITVENRDGQYRFEIIAYEGDLVNTRFVVDDPNNTEFIIPNRNVDMSTLKVTVRDSLQSTTVSNYQPVNDIVSVGPEDLIYYLKLRHDVLYELSFGNNVFGKALEPDNIVTATYINTNGPDGNGCSDFYYIGGFRGDVIYRVESLDRSYGGARRENIESVRFNAPRNYIAQNRAVTTDDYKSQIIKTFPFVESVNVWGGQDNVPPVYGKIFISAKPFDKDKLSETEKNEIKQFFESKNAVITNQIEFSDPDYIDIILNVNAYYDPINTTKSEGDIKTDIVNSLININESLITSGEALRYSNLTTQIDNSSPSITSNITALTLVKVVIPNLHTNYNYRVVIGNSIKASDGSVRSSEFYCTAADNVAYLINDSSGNVYLNVYSGEGNNYNRSNKPVGIINFETGIIDIQDLNITSTVNSNLLTFNIIPELNNVFKYQNNIIRINVGQSIINILEDTNG